MPENNETAVFIQLVTKAIESVAGLTTKVDGVVKTQERQDLKLDTLSTTLTRIETMSSSMVQRIETVESKVSDHETRLRFIEPVLSVVKGHDDKLGEIAKDNKDQAVAINDLRNELFKYGIFGAVGLFILQVLVTAFVIPWLQSLIFIAK